MLTSEDFEVFVKKESYTVDKRGQSRIDAAGSRRNNHVPRQEFCRGKGAMGWRARIENVKIQPEIRGRKEEVAQKLSQGPRIKSGERSKQYCATCCQQSGDRSYIDAAFGFLTFLILYIHDTLLGCHSIIILRGMTRRF